MAEVLDALNLRLGTELLADGRVYVGTTRYRGLVAFRPAIVNWRTTEADVDSIVDVVRPCLRCQFTVLGLMPSSAAICFVLSPRASSFSTWTSRWERGDMCGLPCYAAITGVGTVLRASRARRIGGVSVAVNERSQA